MEHLNYNQVNLLRQKTKELNQQKYAESCRQRLDKIISTKIRTTFIGAIDSIEKYFGFLWGQDKEDEDLTKEEQEMYEIWQQLRVEILNKGNLQLRSAKNEISNHSVEMNRYTYTFKMENRGE